MAGMVMTKLSPSRPVSALVARGETPSFLYASTWASQQEQQEMLVQRDVQRAAGAADFEKHPLCSRTVERRVKKLIASELPLSDWNLQQILDWLEYRGLHQHRELFKRAEVDGKVLQRLSCESIRTKIGIKGLGHRRAITEELRHLKSYLAEHSSSSIRPGSSHHSSSPARPKSARDPKVHTTEELSQLRLQRAQWQRDRLHLMSMMGRKPTFLTVPAEEWTPHEVCDWIDYIGLNWYRKSFAHGAIDGTLLTSMTDKLLEAEVGIKSLEHRRLLLDKIKELEQNGAGNETTGEEEPTQLSRTQLGQVQGQLRECDFNIMRLDQRIARAKKIVGIHEPKTNEYRSAMERARDERANMAESRTNNPGEKWWERQFNAFETKVKNHHALREKSKKEECKGNRMD